MVVFSKGQLVQIYRSDLDYTFKTNWKLIPKWSAPQRVIEQNLNSYRLERLDGTPIAGSFSARRLREFIPREGTKLAKDQAALYQQSTENNQMLNMASGAHLSFLYCFICFPFIDY